jgi:hypothetical protein
VIGWEPESDNGVHAPRMVRFLLSSNPETQQNQVTTCRPDATLSGRPVPHDYNTMTLTDDEIDRSDRRADRRR